MKYRQAEVNMDVSPKKIINKIGDLNTENYRRQFRDINLFLVCLQSLPNQRQMRVWHLSGLNMGQSQSQCLLRIFLTNIEVFLN